MAKGVFSLHLAVTLNMKRRKTVEASNCKWTERDHFNLRLSQCPKQITVFIKQDIHFGLCFTVLVHHGLFGYKVKRNNVQFMNNKSLGLGV